MSMNKDLLCKIFSRKRDPARIERVLDKLNKLWQNNPEIRLGQLIHVIIGDNHADLFILEDDKLEESLDRLIRFQEEDTKA